MMSSRGKTILLVISILMLALSPSPGWADSCKSKDGAKTCNCKGACQSSNSDCRCAAAGDPGKVSKIPCMSQDGKVKLTCEVACERTKTEARCNPK